MRLLLSNRPAFAQRIRNLPNHLQQNLRWYRDPALQWAERNKIIAQQCLQPPMLNVAEIEDQMDPSTWTMQDYLNFRKWPLPLEKKERKFAVSLASHVLSTPLTTALFYSNVFAQSSLKSTSRLCCVGARAEATLPHEYWKEFLTMVALATGSHISLHLHFVGPDIHDKTKTTTVKWSQSEITLDWYHKGMLHHLEDSWDAYLLMNPGLGHENLKENWEPTLIRLLQSESPILLTAHSEKDANRDASLLKDAYEVNVEYRENPFASQIQYEDPFDKLHIVRPNHYVAIVK